MCEGEVENDNEEVEYFTEDETTEVDVISKYEWFGSFFWNKK